MGWLSLLWSYRTPLVVGNASGAGTGYVVPITVAPGVAGAYNVGLNNHCVNFPFDVAFTDSGGVSQLPHWLEYYDGYVINNGQGLGGLWGCAYGYPNAYYFSGTHHRTYVCYAGPQGTGGKDGDPYVIYYDHDTKTWSDPVKAGNNPLPFEDGHGPPSLIVDNAGYIHVAWGCHATTAYSAVQYARSTNPEDISSWVNKTSAINWVYVTYPAWAKDASGNIYLFMRVSPGNGTGSQCCFQKSTSTPKGDTWSGQTNAVVLTSTYVCYKGTAECDIANNRVHITWVTIPTGASVRFNLYHAYLNVSDGYFYNMAGTKLNHSGGKYIDQTDAENNCKVVNSGTKCTDDPMVHLDSSGNPYISYTEAVAGATYSDSNLKLVYWDGAEWSSEIQITYVYFSEYGHDFYVNPDGTIDAYFVSFDQSAQKWHGSGSPLSFSKVATIYPQTRELAYGLCCVAQRPATGIQAVICVGKNEQDPWESFTAKVVAIDTNDVLANKVVNGAGFRVKVSADLGSSPQTIIMYYCKQNQFTLSSAVDTFIFFDHFDGKAISGTNWALTGSPTLDRSVVTLGLGVIMDTVATYGLNYAVEVFAISVPGTQWNEQTIGFNYDIRDVTCVEIYSGYSKDYFDGYTAVVGSGNTMGVIAVAWDTYLHLCLVGRGGVSSVFFQVDSSPILTLSNYIPQGSYPVTIGNRNSGGPATLWADMVLVRPCVYPEPAFSSAGAEQGLLVSPFPCHKMSAY